MKKRILYIGNDLQLNSFTATYISFFSKMLKREGYPVKTASTRSNKAVRLLEMLWLIVRHYKTTDVVLIDTYGARNFYYAYLVAKTCSVYSIDYIPILHSGNLPERLEKSKKFSQFLFGNAKVNIAPSAFLHDIFKAKGFQNIKTIPNAIELQNYPFKKRTDFKPKLLWVRRFQKRYNPMLALQVLKLVQKRYPHAQLCMVGPEKDGTRKECINYAEKHRLKVDFPGKLNKKEWAELASGYDFFLNTTSIDNTPISVIEAMALGLTIISTRVGGMEKLIDDKINGILVPENDAQAMTNTLIECLKNNEQTTVLCSNARTKVENFDWQIVKTKWEEVLS